MAEELRLQVLGGVQITRNNVPLAAFVSSKAPALLAYLAVTGRPHFRSALAGLLWSELPEDVARRNLRTVLANLRQTLAPYLIITRDTIAFDRAGLYWLDVEQLDAALDESGSRDAERLRAAITLYTGDFLDGFVVRDAPVFDEWAATQRERLRQRVSHALHEIVEYDTRQGSYAAGIAACTRLLQLDPWREDAHRQLMRLLAMSDQRSAALVAYAACCRVLEAELGAEAAPETTRLYEQIRDGLIVPVQPKGVAGIALPAAPQRRPHLPLQSTSLVGRDVELAQIAQHLAGGTCRLLTLIGLGGIGKTQLALHAATAHAATFPDGIAWVSLAAVGTRDQVLIAIAEALGITFAGPHEPQTQVLEYLREKRLLLLLDNLEHLPDAQSLIQAIVQAAPRVIMLATSRERLNLQAEWLLDVQGLPYPLAAPAVSDGGLNAAQLKSYAAVQLFVQRAIQVQPSFTLAGDNLSAVIRICQLVYGIPLGIELAAALVRTTSCTDIADELAQSLDVLATTLWDMPASQRSLHAVFDYSWHLLSVRDRATLAQLAVFRGGFRSAVAKAVVAVERRDLAALIDTSVLHHDGNGRYVLHPLVQQFAAERLVGEWPERHEAAQGRHSTYYLDFVHGRATALRGRAPQSTITEVRADLDNIRAAWQWAVDHAQLDGLERAAPGLALVYELLGLVEEGTAVFAATAARVRTIDASPAMAERMTERVLGILLVLYARFLTYQAHFAHAMEVVQEARQLAQSAHAVRLDMFVAYQAGQTLTRQTHYEPARTELAQALTLARSLELSSVEADSLFALGETALWQGKLDAVQRYHQHALERYHGIGDQRGEGLVHNQLGLVALFQGHYAVAEGHETQALHCFRAVGSQMDEAFVLLCLGQIALARDDYAHAETLQTEALELYRTIGNRHGEIVAQSFRGHVPLQQGNYAAARTAFQQALGLHRAIADRRGECDMLANLGLVAHLTGDNVTAYTLSQQALDIAQAIGNQQFQARALTFLGHALVALNRLEEAVSAYTEAVALRRMLHQHHFAMEPLAGLARVVLVRGDLEEAQTYVREILAYVANGTLAGTFEPLRVYLTCYEVLHARADPGAAPVLQTAYQVLQDLAATIGNPEVRHSFLAQVTVRD